MLNLYNIYAAILLLSCFHPIKKIIYFVLHLLIKMQKIIMFINTLFLIIPIQSHSIKTVSILNSINKTSLNSYKNDQYAINIKKCTNLIVTVIIDIYFCA